MLMKAHHGLDPYQKVTPPSVLPKLDHAQHQLLPDGHQNVWNCTTSPSTAQVQPQVVFQAYFQKSSISCSPVNEVVRPLSADKAGAGTHGPGISAWAERVDAASQTDLSLKPPRPRPRSVPSGAAHARSMPNLRPKSGKPHRAQSASKAMGRRGPPLSSDVYLRRASSATRIRKPSGFIESMKEARYSNAGGEQWWPVEGCGENTAGQTMPTADKHTNLAKPRRVKSATSLRHKQVCKVPQGAEHTHHFFKAASKNMCRGASPDTKKSRAQGVPEKIMQHLHYHAHLFVDEPPPPGEHVVFPLRPKTRPASAAAALPPRTSLVQQTSDDCGGLGTPDT